MSRDRFGKSAAQTLLRHDLDGWPLCRWCGNRTPNKRRTFCSDTCGDEWYVRRSSSFARAQVLRRDQGICARCAFDTQGFIEYLMQVSEDPEERRTILRRFDQREGERRGFRPRPGSYWVTTLTYDRARQAAAYGENTLWDADHIVPVILGGGEAGLDGYRMLCVWCHRAETTRLHRRMNRIPPPDVRAALKGALARTRRPHYDKIIRELTRQPIGPLFPAG